MRRRLSDFFIFVLILSFVGLGGVPAHADPTPAHPDPAPTRTAPVLPDEVPKVSGEKFREAPQNEPYEYDSVQFWRIEMPWDSEYLSTRSLRDIKTGRNAYKGQVGTREHLLSYWKRYMLKAGIDWDSLTDQEKQAHWNEYLDSYIGMIDNKARGASFEKHFARLLNLVGLGYLLDKGLKGHLVGVPGRQRGDAFKPGPGGVWFEFKSGGSRINRDQARLYAKIAAENGKSLVYIFGSEPDSKDLEFLEELNKEMAEITGHNNNVVTRSWPATGSPKRHPKAPDDNNGSTGGGGSPTPTGPPGPTGSLAAQGQYGADSASGDAISNSPSSPETAAARADMEEGLAEEFENDSPDDADLSAEQLGGVDFSTLELRYVSDTYSGGLGTGVQYAYQVDGKSGEKVSYGGRAAAQLATDSFFTWLALPPTSFTVNLNPNEPERILDSKFGTTDAGRVLLQADFQMKKTVAKLINPKTKAGAEHWEALRGEKKCLSMRQWIVPKPAAVHENGNELHILDAPLDVKMETEYLQAKGGASGIGCADQSSADTEFNEDLYRRTILPQVQKAVNTEREYADLRRVYASRVAAEWYRQRSKTKTTAYSSIIDSGDVSAWPARVKWSPQDVFKAYVKSYKEGEFNVKRTTRRGNYLVTTVYVYGGVDFTRIPRDQMPTSTFRSQHPHRASSADAAQVAPVTDTTTGETWLGGSSTQRPPWNPLPAPASPLGNPWFYVATGLPVVAWLVLSGLLLARRPQRKVTP